MAITKLTVENFKSFDKLEVELRPFNIVVGSNASGKSNFLEVFRFLRDIEATSLESAIGIRGGGETLRNFNLDENQVLRICVETDDVQRDRGTHAFRRSAIGMERHRTTYELSIKFDESDAGFEVVHRQDDRTLQPASSFDQLMTHGWRLEGHRCLITLLDGISPANRKHTCGATRFGVGKVVSQREGDLIERAR